MTIGVTGGIGSGKSTVCSLFESWGADRVDADKVGHTALEDYAVRKALIDAFGEDLIKADGSFNRSELGRRAFLNGETRRRLTDVVWPEVGKRLREVVKASEADLLVVEASVLLERGDPEGIYEKVVVVTASEQVRVDRAMKRQGFDEADVRARMKHQMPEAEKIKHADYVIVNDGTETDLKREAGRVWGALTESVKE